MVISSQVLLTSSCPEEFSIPIPLMHLFRFLFFLPIKTFNRLFTGNSSRRRLQATVLISRTAEKVRLARNGNRASNIAEGNSNEINNRVVQRMDGSYKSY